MRRGVIVIALLLGGALTVGLFLMMPTVAQGAPPISPASPQQLFYYRVQTVTLHAPPSFDIYDTAFTTTFQIHIRSYDLGGYIRFPPETITRTAYCRDNDTCHILWSTSAVTFAGAGTATVYLEYDTRSRAWRDPGTRNVTLHYPVGPDDPSKQFSLINTIVFSRTLEPALIVNSPIAPGGYTYDQEAQALRWEFASTSRLEFIASFIEPLLGADLVVERLELSNLQPDYDEYIRFTITVRNSGTHATGRAILAELFVRPLDLGPPDVLTDHVGGWSWFDPVRGIQRGYHEDALFKWYKGSVATDDYWWPGLEPGDAITGTTVLKWPDECTRQTCGVWAKADPTYLEVGDVYEWYGYNPEGFDCEMDENVLPTCAEENNNIEGVPMPAVYTVYLPLVMRSY